MPAVTLTPSFNNPDKSTPPLNVVAVTIPVILPLPVPVILLPFKLRSPPSSGVVSSTTFPIPVIVRLAEISCATISTISFTVAPSVKTTLVPFVAVNSS